MEQSERMSVPERIAACGKTHQEIADAVGVSRSAITRIANGDRAPGPEIVRELARALGCQPSDLRPDLASAMAPIDGRAA